MKDIMQTLSILAGNNPFMLHNFVELVSAEQDHVRMQMKVRWESKNIYGILHGGAMYAMADNAATAAAITDGRMYVTQSSDLHFLRSLSDGVIYADAHVRHRGKHTCLVDVIIISQDGVELASCTFSFYCFDPDPNAIETAAKQILEQASQTPL